MSMGYVHSVEIGSFVDGPGTRFVVFLAGVRIGDRGASLAFLPIRVPRHS